MKKIAQFTLLLFALGSIGFWALQKATGTSTTEQSAKSTMTSEAPQLEQAVVVTYFTTDVRCKSCRLIETLTKETLEEHFSQEIAAGTLRFQMLNLDRQENKHFTEDYDLAFKTVVVSTETNGAITHWEKLDDVWTLLQQPEDFKTYVATPIRSLLSPES